MYASYLNTVFCINLWVLKHCLVGSNCELIFLACHIMLEQ